jgi:hypothetical protein
MCRVAHSVLEHRLGATNVAAFITKRAGLLRSQRSVRAFGGRRLWRDRRPQRLQASGGYWGELPAMLDMDFGERPFYEVG